jgi:TonB family protein
MIMAIAMGIFLSTREAVAIVAADFFDRMPQPERNTVLSKELVERQEEIAAKEERKQEEAPTDRKTLRPTESRGQNAQGGGGGDPRSRVTQVGVLGIIGGKITGKTVASADIFGQGGFATDIDAILSGVGGLRPGADGGSGRAGVSGIGFGDGVGSGFGTTGMGGVGDLLDGLMNSRGGGGNLDLKTRGEIRVSSPQIQIGGALSGGRSRISIQRVVLQNMAALRHAYNRRLRDNPGLAGRITVRFAIDEFGSVTFAQMVESTMNDHELERLIVERVHTWRFEKIDKPGDITEVTYPFVFTQ